MDYLKVANISGFDVQEYMGKVNESTVPILGMSISGGGTQSGIGGLGIWQAYDARYPPAVAAGTGGLTQILSYITGLSGGGAVTVSLMYDIPVVPLTSWLLMTDTYHADSAANNFGTFEEIRGATNFSAPYDVGPTGNQTAFFNEIFENAGAKAEAGFPVSAADPFGQFWATWLPENSTFLNYSDLASPGSPLAAGAGPLPIITLAEVVPGQSPEMGNITYPGRNDTNGFNLTSYEVTPFEFGSWLGGRVQGFVPTQWLGTSMSNGTAQNGSECVRGFDRLSFVQGSTTNAFCAWFIDDFYGVPIFAKRSSYAAAARKRQQQQQQQQQTNDIPIPPGQEQSPLVQIVNETASSFQQTFNQSLWATYPNPFEDYNEAMSNVSELLLVDGSLTGENNPIRPLIVPERRVDFIILYEASSEAKYSWVNGTSLQNSPELTGVRIDTARSASQGNIPFPKIPTVDTMIANNFTSQPTLFGCHDDDGDGDGSGAAAAAAAPIVLYLPNSPWTGYSNFSYQTPAFTDAQLDATVSNAMQLATYGNGSVDGGSDVEWPACLACAAVSRSMRRAGVDLPAQCARCFARHCWDGREAQGDDAKGSGSREAADLLDLKPRLNPSLTFQEWNTTVWQAQQAGGDGSSRGGGSGNGSGGGGGGGGRGEGGGGTGDSGGTGGASSVRETPVGSVLSFAILALGFAVTSIYPRHRIGPHRAPADARPLSGVSSSTANRLSASPSISSTSLAPSIRSRSSTTSRSHLRSAAIRLRAPASASSCRPASRCRALYMSSSRIVRSSSSRFRYAASSSSRHCCHTRRPLSMRRRSGRIPASTAAAASGLPLQKACSSSSYSPSTLRSCAARIAYSRPNAFSLASILDCTTVRPLRVLLRVKLCLLCLAVLGQVALLLVVLRVHHDLLQLMKLVQPLSQLLVLEFNLSSAHRLLSDALLYLLLPPLLGQPGLLQSLQFRSPGLFPLEGLDLGEDLPQLRRLRLLSEHALLAALLDGIFEGMQLLHRARTCSPALATDVAELVPAPACHVLARLPVLDQGVAARAPFPPLLLGQHVIRDVLQDDAERNLVQAALWWPLLLVLDGRRDEADEALAAVTMASDFDAVSLRDVVEA
ncbi:LOW QUALITY PROTEIN: lysophospholipase plb1 [Purpureocillium lavendulum]|uniref:Lysophospholipase n=1 Tax=Purpureocillium lavendulum TaxID=1247861 RepID=A0AB34G531_9HYPO|nr:LOW QUALITY PROTEIN: lysophospholipase plb1 [Purpureocillium lavendulum]